MFLWTFLFTLSAALASIFLILGVLVSKLPWFHREFISPLECGFNTHKESRQPISLRFFIFAVIFVIFDIELILVIPVISTFFLNLDTYLLFFIVLNLLTVGLLVEWNNKAFEWLK